MKRSDSNFFLLLLLSWVRLSSGAPLLIWEGSLISLKIDMALYFSCVFVVDWGELYWLRKPRLSSFLLNGRDYLGACLISTELHALLPHPKADVELSCFLPSALMSLSVYVCR